MKAFFRNTDLLLFIANRYDSSHGFEIYEHFEHFNSYNNYKF